MYWSSSLARVTSKISWVSELVIENVSLWVIETLSHSFSKWLGEWVILSVSESVSQTVSHLFSLSVGIYLESQSVFQLVTNSVSKWVSESVSQLVNQWLRAQKWSLYLPTCTGKSADSTLVVAEHRSGPCTFLLKLWQVLTQPWWWESQDMVPIPSYLYSDKCWLYPGGGRAQKWSLYLPT